MLFNGLIISAIVNRTNSEKVPRQKKHSACMYLEVAKDDELSPLQRSNSVNIKPNGTSDNNHTNGKLDGSNGTARLAVSQPLLNSRSTFEQSQMKPSGSGVMYKPDIFYRGSVHSLNRSRASKIDAISETDSQYGALKKITKDIDRDNNVMCGCIPCSKETHDTLTEMMDFGLMRDPVFLIFTLSNFLTSIGFNIPYVYIAAQAEVLKMNKEQASYLLSIIGIANTVGRIILGYFSDKPWVNRLLVYNLCLTTCGIGRSQVLLIYKIKTEF